MADREIKRIIASLNSVSEKKFYVYMLCDQKSIPFYIGKGEEKRVWSVFRICRYAQTSSWWTRLSSGIRGERTHGKAIRDDDCTPYPRAACRKARPKICWGFFGDSPLST